ncbi:MAG: MBL fold metallo-hydrolase [Bacilli bacterium]|jgi:L-ascorbate metabolism protein UlaG (beta-lactamase superfamily)|nr:MBL fold metallo-hydrolase [Bacilli bacterium]
MAKFLYQGHGSYRFITNNNKVVYVDPFAGKGYNLPADLVLITHQHHDHNQIKLINQKPDTIIISNNNALINNEYQHFDLNDIKITALPAYNSHHNKNECVGYLLEFDNLKIYCSGDTGLIDEMNNLHDLNIDYAILNSDNMYTIPFNDAKEATARINAKHNIPIHLDPLNLFSIEKANEWPGLNKLIVCDGQEIEL